MRWACTVATTRSTSARWERPGWLRRGDLSYHDAEWRWAERNRLLAVSRGQEFVADVGRRKAPREWLAGVVAQIAS